jgi:hypothetical protein
MAESMPEDPFVFQLPSRLRESRSQDLRLAWREACSEVRLAYLTWREAVPVRAGHAFAAYVAAIDREAEAAAAIARIRPAPAPGASHTCGSSPLS